MSETTDAPTPRETGTDLLPCPFCGHEAEFERKGTRRQSCIVVCTWCGARHESGDTWDSGASWNRRTPRPDAASASVTEAMIRSLRKPQPEWADSADWSEHSRGFNAALDVILTALAAAPRDAGREEVMFTDADAEDVLWAARLGHADKSLHGPLLGRLEQIAHRIERAARRGATG